MYADTGLWNPCWQSFSSDFQQLEELCKYGKTNDLAGLDPASVISDYALGNEVDFFKTPEPFIEESDLNLDPESFAMSMLSCGEDAAITQGFSVAEMEPLDSIDNLFNDVYECKNDMFGKTAFEQGLEEVLDFKIPPLSADENCILEDKVFNDLARTKSVSSECLSSMEWIHASTMTSSFLDMSNGMRRAYSEGDIKTLSHSANIPSVVERTLNITCCSSEDRKEKLSRYRNKKSKRNFGRKIKYACRKALADSQPRIRGRFAKTEETESFKAH